MVRPHRSKLLRNWRERYRAIDWGVGFNHPGFQHPCEWQLRPPAPAKPGSRSMSSGSLPPAGLISHLNGFAV